MRTNRKALCIVTGGIGDEILALPAIRFLSDAIGPDAIDLRLGGWKERRRLYENLLGCPVQVRPLEALWRCATQHIRTYDLIFNFDTRDAMLDTPLPPPVGYRIAYLAFGETFPLHDNDGSLLWQRCLAMVQSVVSSDNKGAAINRCQFSEPPRNARFRLAVSPGGYSPPLKRWPAESFARVIRHALDLDADVFLLGSGRERELADRIHGQVGELIAGRLFVLAGPLALEELPDLLRSMDLHLTNDNGAAHIGGAVNARQIVLYRGVTSLHRTMGQRDIALFSGDEEDMSGIRCEDVIQQVSQWVQAGTQTRQTVEDMQ